MMESLDEEKRANNWRLAGIIWFFTLPVRALSSICSTNHSKRFCAPAEPIQEFHIRNLAAQPAPFAAKWPGFPCH